MLLQNGGIPNLIKKTTLTENYRVIENEVVAEEHVPSETVAEYAEEVQTYLTDIGVNFDDERAKELSEKMDTVLTFIYKNSSSSYLDT
jgi:hypothetical protein